MLALPEEGDAAFDRLDYGTSISPSTCCETSCFRCPGATT
jgi:hypothetical protein